MVLTGEEKFDIMKLTSHEVHFISREGSTIKTKIRDFRNSTGITQQQLADLVHVSARTIISIEKEQYNPSLMLAYRIARVFGVTVEELCCLEENMRLEDEKYESI